MSPLQGDVPPPFDWSAPPSEPVTNSDACEFILNPFLENMIVVEKSPPALTRYDFWEICNFLFLSLFSLSDILFLPPMGDTHSLTAPH